MSMRLVYVPASICPEKKTKTEELIQDRKAHPISCVGAELEDDHGQKSYLPQTTASVYITNKAGCAPTVATVWPLSAGHTPCEINAPALEEASGPKLVAELVRPALISRRN